MSLDQHLQRSGATPAFREAADRFLRTGRPNERIEFDAYSPPVKIERALIKALVEYPALPIESIEFQANSGCEHFRGTLLLRTAEEEREVRFNWDCKWKAQQLGWADWFGFPDQARAAREYGWDCFRTLSEEGVRPMEAPAAEEDLVPA